ATPGRRIAGVRSWSLRAMGLVRTYRGLVTLADPDEDGPMCFLRLLSLGAIVALGACAKAPPPAEGYVTVPGGKIYYGRMGNGPGTPLIVIHGGPGAGSYSLKPFGALGDDRPVIRYDQLGAGKADHPTDTTLFTVDRAVQELQALRDSLGLTEVHLLG